MIGIVLSPNFLMLFIFWELVAASSYLLISFWFEKPSAADAGNKAFIVNRVADFGFLLGILLLWALSGAGNHARTLNFGELHQKDAQQESEVRDAVHDERLVACIGGGRFFEPEANEEIRARGDEFPEDEEHQEIGREEDADHRKGEERSTEVRSGSR
jgi:hypothetical protein